MLKKTITYTDFNGDKKTEDFYFNLTKAEIMELEMSVKGGLTELIKQIINTEDNPKLISLFKKLILMSYGVKSVDGKRFMKKNPEGGKYSDEFEETEAYSELFMELASDSDAAVKFVNGIIPADAAKQLAEQNK